MPKPLQCLYLASGFVAVGLGVLGIALPLLPTTPFLLLAAFLFARSSERWHNWLVNHRHLGPYIHAFRSKQGLTAVQKVRLGLSVTVVLAISYFFAPLPYARALVAMVFVGMMGFLLISKTAEAPADSCREESVPRD